MTVVIQPLHGRNLLKGDVRGYNSDATGKQTPPWRGRIVRSSAHDWKSCIPKGIEGSNPSLSAIAFCKPLQCGGGLLRWRDT
jgi:hypothetical protein